MASKKKTTTKKKAGRPKLNLTPEGFEMLAKSGATHQDVADHYGCSVMTVRTRLKDEEFREAWARGASKPKRSLRLAMLEFIGIDENGDRVGIEHKHNPTGMMIFLAKNWLGMTDRIVNEVQPATQRAVMVVPPDKSVEEWVKEHGEVVIDQKSAAN